MIRRENLEVLLTELNTTDEGEELEAKTIAGRELGKSVFETICALCNEPDLEGGTILLGVSKEEALFPLYHVTGVSDPDKLSSDLATGCASVFNQPIRIDVKALNYRGHVVLKIDVPEVPKSHKPIYFKSVGLPKGAFRRVGPTDVKCTDEDLALFYQGGSSDPFDIRIVRDATWADIDPSAVSAYRKARAEVNPLAEELNWPDEEILYALSGIRRIDDKIKITTTGLLVFGKSASIRRLFPAHRVDYIRIPGKNWVQDIDGKFESIDMRGPMMLLISRVIAAIADDLPKTLRMDDNKSGQRTETPVLPFRVIREAVVNALMHRSYQFHQPIQIIRYANRIVIKNAGYSLKSPERFADPGSSIRNPNIAAILHETRFAETKGSGIRVMQTKMQQRGLASPTFESKRDTDEFIATFLFHHFLDGRDLDWLAKFIVFDLNEDQMKALVFVREVGAIDNSTYRSLCTIDTLGASRNLRALTKLDLLTDRGSGVRTHYVAGPEMIARDVIDREAPGEGAIHDSDVTMDDTIHGNDNLLRDMPIFLRTAVRNAQFRRRLAPEEGRQLIEALCQWRPLSLSEISDLIGKTSSHVSQKYIAPMVSSRTLEYLYPEMPQHPEQKYRATKPKLTNKRGPR